MDGWTGNEIYNLSEDVSRSDKSRCIIESARSRRLSGDREGETAGCDPAKQNERGGAGVQVCVEVTFVSVAVSVCVSMSERARAAVRVQLTDGD